MGERIDMAGETPIKFIQEEIQVWFKNAPVLEKKPGCPDGFTWRGKQYQVIELLSEWHDYHRKGKMAQNMRPTHAEHAERRGSWGVGVDTYRVLTDSGQIFDLNFDRAPKDASRRKGAWFVFQELSSDCIEKTDHDH